METYNCANNLTADNSWIIKEQNKSKFFIKAQGNGRNFIETKALFIEKYGPFWPVASCNRLHKNFALHVSSFKLRVKKNV